MYKIRQTIIDITQRVLLFLVLGVGGVMFYKFYQKQTTHWQQATLYLYGNQAPYKGEFAFENGEIVQETRCKRTQRYKSGKHFKIRCIGEYSVYVSKDGQVFEVAKVKRVQRE